MLCKAMTNNESATAKPSAVSAEVQATANRELVYRYLAVATPGNLNPDRIREFLADDVLIEDALMPSTGADAFVEALRQTPSGGDMSATVSNVVADESVAVARVLFRAGEMAATFSQWFWIENGRFSRIEVVYDPRPFLTAQP